MEKRLIIWILIATIVLLSGALTYLFISKSNAIKEAQSRETELSRSKGDLEKMNKELEDENFRLKNEIESLNRSTIPFSNPIEEAKEKAQKASIKSIMSSTTPLAIICQDGGGNILSGNADGPACSNDSKIKWPGSGICGENPSDLKFTVFNGGNDNWDVTINCTKITDCNGPDNALCNALGCQFKGMCE